MTRVVVGIIIKNSNPPTYLLVSSNRDFGVYSGYYYPPGGHLEKNESELTALKREIKEELGLEIVNAEKITETAGDIKDQITSWYFCNINDDEITIDKKELADARFFTEEEIKYLKVWPATKKIFNQYVFHELK